MIHDKIDEKTCLTCRNRMTQRINGLPVQYCSVRLSNESKNGFQQIKAKDKACKFYRP